MSVLRILRQCYREIKIETRFGFNEWLLAEDASKMWFAEQTERLHSYTRTGLIWRALAKAPLMLRRYTTSLRSWNWR